MSKETKSSPTLPFITLSEAITIDGKEVTEIDLRKPNTGELRGLKLTEILQMDINTMITLLPRITVPPLSGSQIAALPPEDFTDLASQTVVFFARKGQLQAL